ncbi:piggyBac transposable element-derived protein 2-like [Pectinophora gossypiella]|uniref:piggyBac transposable element-derived protein 2-like n=1 Tax=Pectinophora gossypiella TaxID=13191 RepID=UPI00214DF318|nr:piggyBac transposable element-derived protein 2-like [Pectinophora gossypiella]
MSRNRFELLLQNLHFVDNEKADTTDRIYKIRGLIDILNKSFRQYYFPKEDVCVDESQVPYRGRLIFRQYNKSKRHKYGMKLFKLCTIPGYTCKLELYAGTRKNHEQVNTTPKNVVMSLCKEILDLGHTVSTDNWYTSLDLANELIDRSTHLVGTLRKNRKGLPKQVIGAKLKRGESVAMENERGITVLHWKDKRSVFMLSTKHSKGFASVHKKGKVFRKPKMIIAYNRAKGAVDMSDQMSAYSSPLRKTIKWYKKLGIELILNTAVVNAWIMFSENTAQRGIVEFRRQLVEYLIDSGKEVPEDVENESISKRPKRLKHTLKIKEGKVRQSRRFCIDCYKSCVSSFGSRIAKNKAKKVASYCFECPGQPHYCLECFNKCHRYF